MEFKNVDMVICKKDFIPRGYTLEKICKIQFIKNKEYKITYSGYWSPDENLILYEIDGNYNKNVNLIRSFYANKNDDSLLKQLNLTDFHEYFYSKTELRKMKLNKLKNERD